MWKCHKKGTTLIESGLHVTDKQSCSSCISVHSKAPHNHYIVRGADSRKLPAALCHDWKVTVLVCTAKHHTIITLWRELTAVLCQDWKVTVLVCTAKHHTIITLWRELTAVLCQDWKVIVLAYTAKHHTIITLWRELTAVLCHDWKVIAARLVSEGWSCYNSVRTLRMSGRCGHGVISMGDVD